MNETGTTTRGGPQTARTEERDNPIRFACMERCEEMRSGTYDLPKALERLDFVLLGVGAVVGLIMLIVGV